MGAVPTKNLDEDDALLYVWQRPANRGKDVKGLLSQEQVARLRSKTLTDSKDGSFQQKFGLRKVGPAEGTQFWKHGS
jgi:hypothetical protein